MSTFNKLKDFPRVPTTRLIMTIPLNMIKRFKKQAVRDGCFRSPETKKPNMTRWILLTLAQALDDDLAEGMVPYQPPGRPRE